MLKTFSAKLIAKKFVLNIDIKYEFFLELQISDYPKMGFLNVINIDTCAFKYYKQKGKQKLFKLKLV